MVKCELCGKEFKNTQGLRGHMTFVHGKTGSSAILSAPVATEQRLSELETRLEKLESITGVKEESTLDRLLGTDKPLTEQLLDHTRQFTQLRKQITELTNQLNSSNISNTELTKLNEQATGVTHKLDELKASHNRLREGYEKLIPWLHNLEGQLNSVDGLKQSVNNGLGKLEREMGGVRSKLQPLTVLPSKVETLKSDVVRLSDRVASAERRAKQKPTDDIEEIEFKNGKTHKFKVYKSTDGLVKPHRVTWDPISGNKYVDLSEPLD